MPNSKWLWLSEAADRIASRLTQTEPERFPSRSKALKFARKQLLEEAYRGDIEVRGKDVVPQEEPRFEPREWKTVEAELWDPTHRHERMRSPLKVELNWKKNFILCEAEGTEWIIRHLQVKADDVDDVWPPHIGSDRDKHRSSGSSTQNMVILPKSKGGRPSKYQPDLWLQLLKIAEFDGFPLTPDGLLDRPELKRRLMEFSRSRWGAGSEPSKTTIDDLLKLVYDSLSQKQ